jgi:uncharacterized lipoprotein YbaY
MRTVMASRGVRERMRAIALLGVLLVSVAGCTGPMGDVPDYGVLATETRSGEAAAEVDGRSEVDEAFNLPRGSQRVLAVLSWGGLVDAPDATLALEGPDGKEVPHDAPSTNGTAQYRSLSTTFEPVTQAPYTFRLRFDGATTTTSYALQITVLGDRKA